MAAYKALTHVNLPFLDGNGRLYAAGSLIPEEAFEESVELATEAINDPNAEIVSAEDMIADLIKWGSISEDPDAELHPDHRPVVPGQPTVNGLAEQARQLIASLEESGDEVPPELQQFADAIQSIAAGDEAAGGDVSA